MDKSETDAGKAAPGIDFRRDQEFLNRYANNIYLESTIWDLKITFGQTDLAAGHNAVVQHTAITLPWPYVKIFAYLLQTHLTAREVEDGRIPVPKNIVAAPPTEMPKEFVGKLKHPKEGMEAIQKLWKEFITANPEVKP
jgi:hypothetical protein